MKDTIELFNRKKVYRKIFFEIAKVAFFRKIMKWGFRKIMKDKSCPLSLIKKSGRIKENNDYITVCFKRMHPRCPIDLCIYSVIQCIYRIIRTTISL